MNIQPFHSFWRLAQLTGLAAVLTCACTVEHMEVGVDQGGIDGVDTEPSPGADDDCPNDCPVPDICKVCEGTESTCATPDVQCKADGSCGEIEWVCPNDPSAPTEPACPDVCEAVCNGKPEPEIPQGCPIPDCGCEEPPPSGGDCECAVPAICQLCDDNTCATPNVECKADGSCGELTWTCSTTPSECPDPAALCEAQCNGKVLDVAPDCPVSDCDCEQPPACDCPIPEICKVCDDGTCAVGNGICDANGECSEVLWTCKGEPEPTPDCDCAIDAVCQLCDDGSCAKAEVECNPDGSCGETTLTCPTEPATYDCDVRNVECDVAINCEEGTVPTRNGSCYGPCVAPEQCGEAVPYDCDTSEVTCKVAIQCDEGLVPTQEGSCYGPCVKPEECKAAAECPDACAIPLICNECEDGTCASAKVACNDDGTCGDIEWTCPSGEPATEE
jgi:hypothetical protein